MHSRPEAEHKWLKQLPGDWTLTRECAMPPTEGPGFAIDGNSKRFMTVSCRRVKK